MELISKQPTRVKNIKTSREKTIHFLNSDGVKKVFDIHRYSEKGTLYFKRKTSVVAV